MVSLPQHLKFNVNTSDSINLDSNGRGVLYMGPAKVRERWVVEGMSTTIDSDDATFNPRLHIYKNGHELIAGTFNGNDDTSSGDNIELRNGESLKCVMSNGQPNKRWEMTISGRGYAV